MIFFLFLYSIFEASGLPVSARVEGCGISNFIDGAVNLFYNPALLKKQAWHDVSVNFHRFDEVNNGSIGISIPFKKFVMASAISYTNTDFELRDEFDNLKGKAGFTNLSIRTGIGFGSKDFCFGGAINLFYETISTVSYMTGMLDIGFNYNYSNYNFSIALNNLGIPSGRNKKSNPPYTLRTAFSGNFLDEELNLGVEFLVRERNLIFNTGIEYLISKIFYIRGGFIFRSNTSLINFLDIFRFGFGFIYTERFDYLIDFAYVPNTITGGSILVSSGIRF